MCGVIGYYSDSPKKEHGDLFYALARESKIRGLHSFGVSWLAGEKINTLKWLAFPALSEWKRVAWGKSGRVIWHNRYSTSGDWRDPRNNQPIDIGVISVASNSVITMAPPEEWERLFGVKCETANDTEIFARIVAQGGAPAEFVSQIIGSFAGVYLFKGELYAVRNERRPLHWFKYRGATWVVSTVDIPRRAFRLSEDDIHAVPPRKEIRVADL